MSKTIDISVVLPVYNGMEYLEKSIESVLSQETNTVNYEIIICDDCSTDESYSYLESLKSERIKLFRNEKNKGLFPTLNFLIKQTSAPLVHLWAQDDIMFPNCLEKTVEFHQQFPIVKFSFSRLQGIDETGTIRRIPETFPNRTLSVLGHAVSSLLYGSIAGNIANVCLVKKAAEEVGYFDESMIYVGDFKMWCLLSKDTPVGMNGNILVNVRQHQGQLSKSVKASLNKLIENREVYACFLQTIENDELRKELVKALRWKIYPTYLNQYFFILKQRKFKLSKKYVKELKKYDRLTSLLYRWIVIRVMRFLKKEQQFYKRKFITKIMDIKGRLDE